MLLVWASEPVPAVLERNQENMSIKERDSMKQSIEKIALTGGALLAAGISPNLFVIAQAGYAKLSALAVNFLIPSIVVLLAILLVGTFRGHTNLVSQIWYGILGGLVATVGLEIVRHVGFLLGGMPGEMPKLLGVLLLDRFALGPNWLSNLAGWGYHFWNGAAFGIVYTLLFGKTRLWGGIAFGVLIGIGFMISPATTALGVGIFGIQFNIGFPLTVTLAHVAFGTILGWYVQRNRQEAFSIIQQIKGIAQAR